jgi:hypothetical protein
MIDKILPALFDLTPLAQLIVDPFRDQVLALNQSARKLFELSQEESPAKVTSLFSDCQAELFTITEAALHKGSAWSDGLIVRNQHRTISLETSVTQINLDSQSLLLLSCQDAAHLFELRQRSSANRQHQTGLVYWNRY